MSNSFLTYQDTLKTALLTYHDTLKTGHRPLKVGKITINAQNTAKNRNKYNKNCERHQKRPKIQENQQKDGKTIKTTKNSLRESGK